jgi:hypothetical protein
VDVLAAQLVTVRQRYSEARFEQFSDGTRALVVPGIPLCRGWSASSTTVRVLVPVGFPHIKPDCFYADSALRLATGGEPASSNIQNVFEDSYRWFSWHIVTWDPVRGSLDQYLHVCESRLKDVR